MLINCAPPREWSDSVGGDVPADVITAMMWCTTSERCSARQTHRVGAMKSPPSLSSGAQGTLRAVPGRKLVEGASTWRKTAPTLDFPRKLWI